MYHFVITLQWPHTSGFVTSTVSSIFGSGGHTRESAYKEIRDYAIRHTGASANASVMFFVLEPNELWAP